MKTRFIFPKAVIALFFMASCSIMPQEIDYGHDNCVECQMAIMDRRYGAEIVTSKGKIYKFDSIECLADFLVKESIAKGKIELTLVTHYTNPGKLTCAFKSHILHSKGLPSPMGKYLTAFGSREEADIFRLEHGGRIYSWEEFMAGYRDIHNDLLD